MPKFKIWEHHNPKIAEPYMDDLLKKLSESSSNWYGDSYCNDCMANVSLQYQKDKFIHIQIPNSKNDRPEEEEFAKFYVYHRDEQGDTHGDKACESLDEAVKVATDLLKKLGGERMPSKDKNDLAIEYINQMLSDQYSLIDERKTDPNYESDEELKEFTESELSEIRNAQRYMDLQTEVMP
tara:strand:- start:1039 stop:1581 length:543 start_codon:yes stop_codon:yes gene_type:complete